MQVTYYIDCFERELTVTFPDDYEPARDEIYNILDWAYDRWIHVSEIEDEEDYLIVHDMCCEQYMVEYILAPNYDYLDWDSVYIGDEEEE